MKTITKQQYYCLIGLQELAKAKWKEISELEKAAIEITEEKDGVFGHTSDFIAGSRDADELLSLLNIEVRNDSEI